MDILVLVKHVPDTETMVRVAGDGMGITTEGVNFVVNPYDEFAVEEALRINNFMRGVHDLLVPLYREAKQLKKAVRSARCRVALRTEEDADEDVARMWLDLADVLLDAGQVREARAALDEAKKLTDAEALPRIAEVEKRIGA